MTPLFYLFSICFSFMGADDCSWSGEIIEDRLEFESLYAERGGQEEPSEVAGYTRYPEKTLTIGTDRILETFVHEVKHMKCWDEYEIHGEIEIAKNCHYWIDVEYNAQSTHQVDSTPEPPKITEKMAYQELMYSNKEFGQ